MPTTQEIEQAAKDLGKLVGDHAAAQRFDDAAKALDNDIEAQRLLTDFNRAIQEVAQKQAQQKPIEVADKKKLEDLQTQVAMNLKVRAMQQAQMDYVDLLRKVVTTITTEAGGVDPQAAGVIEPGQAGGPGANPLQF